MSSRSRACLRRLAVPLLVLAALLGASPASAQSASSARGRAAAPAPAAPAPAPSAQVSSGLPDCRDNPACMELVESARRLSASNQLNAALVTYEKAFAQSRSSWLMISMGRIQQKLGRPAEAILTYQKYLSDAANQPPEGVQAATEYLQQAEQDLRAQREREQALIRNKEKPVYKKPWFWVVVGGAAAVAAAGITAGVVLGTREIVPNGTPAANHIRY